MLIQCLIQSQTIKDEEMAARFAGVYAGKLLLWFFLLIISLSYFLFDNNDILMNMLVGGIYYLCIVIFDYFVNKYKFLTEK
jgi:Ca2+/Na+ antiporter